MYVYYLLFKVALSNSNSPFILKGQNFSTENILPPNFGLEDVFLRNEQKQKALMQGSILLNNVRQFYFIGLA